MKYNYISPKELGYDITNISRKEYNKLGYNLNYMTNIDIWFNTKNKTFIIEKTHSKIAILLCILIFPFVVIFNGVKNINELLYDIKTNSNQKKYGKYYKEVIYSTDYIYDKLIGLIKN